MGMSINLLKPKPKCRGISKVVLCCFLGLVIGGIFGASLGHVLREDVLTRATIYNGIIVDVAQEEILGRAFVSGHRRGKISWDREGPWESVLPVTCENIGVQRVWVKRYGGYYENFVIIQDNQNMCEE